MEPLRRSPSPYFYYGLLLLVIVFFGLLRWHFRNCPLERDEGEYAYAGQLMLHGVPPYQSLYTMKLPGTFAGYAAIFALFGQTFAAIHLGLLVLNAATILLMFLLSRRLFGDLAGLVAAASYALLSTSSSVIGFAGHATHFVVFFAVAGVLVLLSALARNHLWLFFASGLLFGFAFLMKQPGIVFAIFGLIYVAYVEWQRPDRRSSALVCKESFLAIGVVLPFFLTCIAMAAVGAFGQVLVLDVQLRSGIRQHAQPGRRAGCPADHSSSGRAACRVGLGTGGSRRDHDPVGPKGARTAFLLITFLVLSAISVCPGWYFRQHYFVLLLPAISLLVGVAISSLSERLWEKNHSTLWAAVPSLIFVVVFVNTLYAQRGFLFAPNPLAACRSIYSPNPFEEAVAVADYIKQHAAPDARIAVLGSEPEIYFYSGHRAATGYIYTYGLMEPQPYALEMQKQMISEIERAQPQYVVLVNVPQSFGRLPTSNKHIFYWIDSYLASGYQLVGIADISAETKYVWGDEASMYQPRSSSVIKVFKRNGT